MNYWIVPGLKIKSMDELTHYIANYFSIDYKLFFQKTRKTTVVKARKWFYYLAYNYKFGSLSQIGDYTLQDHTTVLHHYKRIKELLEFDKEIQEVHNELSKRL